MSRSYQLASTEESQEISSNSAEEVRQTWFKSKPVTRQFCQRVFRLQLSTYSNDQGYADDALAGSWSWFEIAIFENETASTPREKSTGKKLCWKSHANRIGEEDPSRNFGIVFDRRAEILDHLEEGNVIAVLMCSRFPGWKNKALSGYIQVKELDEDLFSSDRWTLDSSDIPNMEGSDTSVYTFSSETEIDLKSPEDQLGTKLWFRSPAFSKDVVERIEFVQLFTESHDQGVKRWPKEWPDEQTRWSWFDIMILDSPTSRSPKVLNGVELVWSSHANKTEYPDYANADGRRFKREEDLLECLEAGNVLAVRACAQYGWENHAKWGRLVIEVAGVKSDVQTALPNLVEALANNQKFEKKLLEDEDLPSYTVATGLGLPPRADMVSVIESKNLGRRLRILSLDGGGVRGVSPLRIIQELFSKLPKNADGTDAKPCEYFDIIAGTSTGGLLAIMLGRLEMSLEDCFKAYMSFAVQIFSATLSEKAGQAAYEGYQYDSNKIESAIKTLVKERLGSETALMYNPHSNCKVFVVSVLAQDMRGPAVLMRTYVNEKVDDKLISTLQIWQACRATSAAPWYFDQMEINGVCYLDGGVGYNNPVFLATQEAKECFGLTSEFDLILSIGTGTAPRTIMERHKVAQVPLKLAKVATSCETAHHLMQGNVAWLPNLDNKKYIRFNLAPKIDDPAWFQPKAEMLDIAKDTVVSIAGASTRYISEGWNRLIGKKSKPPAQEDPKPVAKEAGQSDHKYAAGEWIDLDDYRGMQYFIDLTALYIKGEKQEVEFCKTRLEGSKYR